MAQAPWPALPKVQTLRRVPCRRGVLALRSSSAPTATAPHAGLRSLAQAGIPVEGLRFDPRMVERGLVIDTLRGSLLKVDRFGLVKRAMHGARMLSPAEIRREYGRGQVRGCMCALFVLDFVCCRPMVGRHARVPATRV
jgi:5' nucleotidase family